MSAQAMTPLAMFDHQLQMQVRLLEKAQRAVVDAVTGQKPVTHWDVEALWAAEEMFRIWSLMESIVEHRLESSEDVDVNEVVAVVAEQMREEALRHRASSRSTNTVSNAQEDVKHDVRLRFLDDLKWGMKF